MLLSFIQCFVNSIYDVSLCYLLCLRAILSRRCLCEYDMARETLPGAIFHCLLTLQAGYMSEQAANQLDMVCIMLTILPGFLLVSCRGRKRHNNRGTLVFANISDMTKQISIAISISRIK